MIVILKDRIAQSSDPDAFAIRRRQARAIFLGTKKTANCDCDSCKGNQHDDWEVQRYPNGAIRIGCQRITKQKVSQVLAWLKKR